MNTNIKVLIYSIAAGIAHVTYIFLLPQCQGEGLGCMAADMGPILSGVIIIPIVFGILGFVLSKEKRFIRAISWLGISFLVILLLNVAGGQLKRVVSIKDQSQNYDACAANYVGSYTCEEWKKINQTPKTKTP
jgi:hypothetical protein